MSEHGATLQMYNQELVKCLEDLKVKKAKLQTIIVKEEGMKSRLETRVKDLLDELKEVNQRLSEHYAVRDKYDQIIYETDSGFKKILESSQTLLNSAQHQASHLSSSSEGSDSDTRQCGKFIIYKD